MKQGDLCYIPQAVQLWSLETAGYNITQTEKPFTGIVLEDRENTILLFVKGQKLLADKNHVYPIAEENNAY